VSIALYIINLFFLELFTIFFDLGIGMWYSYAFMTLISDRNNEKGMKDAEFMMFSEAIFLAYLITSSFNPFNLYQIVVLGLSSILFIDLITRFVNVKFTFKIAAVAFVLGCVSGITLLDFLLPTLKRIRINHPFIQHITTAFLWQLLMGGYVYYLVFKKNVKI